MRWRHSKCWECGQVAGGFELHVVQAPSGPVFDAMVTYQVFPFVCAECICESSLSTLAADEDVAKRMPEKNTPRGGG